MAPDCESQSGTRAAGSCLADDEALAGGLHHLGGDRAELVDVQHALDMGEEALHEAEVAAGDAGDRGDRLGVGVVGRIRAQPQALPLVFEDEA